MPSPEKVDYEQIKEVVDRLKRLKHHEVRKIPIDSKNLKKGYIWPSISMILISKKLNVNVKTLYRKSKGDERIERLLHPFMKKTRNAENTKPSDEPKRDSKTWLKLENEKLRDEINGLKKQKIDLKVKNLQIDELNRQIKEQAGIIERAKESAKESNEFKRENARLLAENARLRAMCMVWNEDK